MLTATHLLPTHCAPTDKNAVTEIRARQPQRYTMSECPELCPISPAEIKRRHRSNFRDLTGFRIGKLEVIGLVNWEDKGRSKWAVKCECGGYELRQHGKTAWKHKKGVFDCCDKCAKKLGVLSYSPERAAQQSKGEFDK